MLRICAKSALIYLAAACAAALAPGVCEAQSAKPQLLPANAKVVFLADNSTGIGPQPYITDGTAAGTRRIPLPETGVGFSLHRLPGKVAMCWERDESLGPRIDTVSYVSLTGAVEHWRAPVNNAIVRCQAVGSTFYFYRQEFSTGRVTLYASAGTVASTRVVGLVPGYVGNGVGRIFRFNGADYMTFLNSATPTAPAIVYRITPTGLVSAFSYGLSSRVCCANWETQVGSRLLFAAWSRATGVELWSTDGTNAGKRFVRSFYPGQTDGMTSITAANPLVAGGRLIFLANDPTYGTEFWASDGTTAGTVRLTNFPSDAGAKEAYADERIMTYQGKAYIAVNNYFLNGRQNGYGVTLYVTDGTPAGTRQLRPMFNGNELLVYDRGAIAGGWLYTRAMQYGIPGCRGDLRDPISGESASCNDALYRYNLATGAVQLVKDVNPTRVGWCFSACDNSNHFTAVGNGVIFSAADSRSASNPPEFNVESWSTLGTAATTTKIREIAPSAVGSNPFAFTPLAP